MSQKPEKLKEAEVCVYPYAYEDDEIDLYGLLLVLKRRWKTIVFSTFILVAVAVVYIFITKPVYKSDFVLKLPVRITESLAEVPEITPYEVKEYINPINQFLKGKKYAKAAKFLNLPEKDVRKLVDINVNTIRGNNKIVKIELETYEPLNIPIYTEKIYQYLQNNPSLREKLQLERKTIQENIKTISSKLKELKKLRDFLLSKLRSGRLNIVGFNPADLDKQILQLKLQLNNLKTQLKSLKGFEISVPPVIPDKPYKPKKLLILAVSLVSGLFLGVFLAFFREWLENAKKQHQLKEQENAKST